VAFSSSLGLCLSRDSGDDCNGDVSLKVANWLRGSDQITNSFDVQFFADVSRARNTGFFVFGIEASMDWPRKSFTLERETRVNPITQALAMRQLLGIPGIATKADIAKHLGISRARVTQTLNLLKLAPEIQQHILELPDDGTAFFSERRLRPLMQIPSPPIQIEAFRGLVSEAHIKNT